MQFDACLLVRALRSPGSMAAFGDAEWDVLIRQARRAELLGYLRNLLCDRDLLGSIPGATKVHLESGYLAAAKQVRDARWEVRCIREALGPTGVPIILLKGAAYVLADLPVGRSRVFGDIDILVPKERIPDVEKSLLAALWVPTSNDPYDQMYYRTWMHQIPPLIHLKRESVIDVHHTIVPETAPYAVSAETLRQASRPAGDDERVRVLAPPHMVLHSASHLFNEGEFDHGLRDLVDLDSLLRHFGDDPEFWKGLIGSAEELDLTRPLFYALRYTRMMLGTPVPDHVVDAVAAWRPGVPPLSVMDALFTRVLLPDHVTCSDPSGDVARWLLYVRAHHLRMPFRLLIPHLTRKAIKGVQEHFGKE